MTDCSYQIKGKHVENQRQLPAKFSLKSHKELENGLSKHV